MLTEEKTREELLQALIKQGYSKECAAMAMNMIKAFAHMENKRRPSYFE